MSRTKKEIADNIRAAVLNVNELIEDAYSHEICVELEIIPPCEDPSLPHEAVESLAITVYEEL